SGPWPRLPPRTRCLRGRCVRHRFVRADDPPDVPALTTTAYPGGTARFRKEKDWGTLTLRAAGGPRQAGAFQPPRQGRNIHCTTPARTMDIRVISTLTLEDEARIAAAIC